MSLFQVILLGTNGYGESILIRLCEHHWIVVDSCEDPYNRRCLPLDYLNSIGVDVKEDVKMIVCSHWHDDHIRGLDTLLEASNKADFVMPIVSDKEKFLKFVEFDSRSEKANACVSSTVILKSCLDIIDHRKSDCFLTNQDRLLYNDTIGDVKWEVYSLTPSDAIIKEFGKELSTLITESSKSNIKIPFNSPNDKCTVLLVTVNNHSVLLGSDLENSQSNDRGWLCILDKSRSLHNKKVSLLKIPHHGSENSFEERLWNDVMIKDNVSMLTPFIKGNISLPTKTMLRQYLNSSSHLFMTSSNLKLRSKVRNKSLDKAISKIKPTIKEIGYNYGLIVCSVDPNKADAVWNTTCEHDACEVTKEFLNKML